MRGADKQLGVIAVAVAAAFLASGYVTRCDVWVWMRAGAGVKEVVAGTDRGRVVVYWFAMVTAGPGMPKGPIGGGGNFHLGEPDWRRSGWEFDGHRMNLPNTSAAWIFACPIWCLLLPCLGYLGWAWHARRKVEGRGFAVEMGRE